MFVRAIQSDITVYLVKTNKSTFDWNIFKSFFSFFIFVLRLHLYHLAKKKNIFKRETSFNLFLPIKFNTFTNLTWRFCIFPKISWKLCIISGEFDKWIPFIHILQSTWILYKITGEFDKLFHINHIPQYDLELYIIAGEYAYHIPRNIYTPKSTDFEIYC